jgi:DNA polymerase (family 10)
MTREQMAGVLEEIALLLELKDENPFKVRACRQGAETVRAPQKENSEQLLHAPKIDCDPATVSVRSANFFF